MLYAFGYFTEISNYINIGILIAYTLLGAVCLFSGNGPVRRVLSFIQCLLIFALQAVSFIHMTVYSRNQDYLFLYLFSQILLLAILGFSHLIYEKENLVLLNNMCMLLGIGFIIISRLNFGKAIRQEIIVAIAAVISMAIPELISRLRIWKKLTWAYAVCGVAALSIVLLLSEVYGGSKISFTIADTITFQPSEFVKILYLFCLAGLLWEDHGFLQVCISALVAGIHVIVLVISTDLGSALIFFIAYVFVVFVATRNYLYLILGMVGGSGAAYLGYCLFDHVRIRVLAWQDPWSYIDGKGFQITQSLFAIGSGNWFGMGLLRGNPKAIPLVDRDFIFSSICEEMGVLSGICIVAICLISFIMMTEIAARVRDRFYQLIVYGIAIVYLFQIFLTIGGGIKFIPLTGVTLPFISYGGSSAMTSMFMFFIVQGIYLMLQEDQSMIRGKKRRAIPKASGESKPSAGRDQRIQPIVGEDSTGTGKGDDYEEIRF